MKKRSLIDRLQDRLWSVYTRHEGRSMPWFMEGSARAGSISGDMAWPQACAAFANGMIPSEHFRRLRAVLEVVETLAPCDGRHHAKLIHAAGHGDWLEHEQVLDVTSWGDPLMWPFVLLGVPHAMAPTSLRYLSHALWLKDQGLIPEGGQVAEIGVGYGGLAAMNALVSGASTTLVDLPDVEKAAMKMLEENALGHAGRPSALGEGPEAYDCVISNYAFTELSADWQDQMLDRFLSRSRHGMILSNAEVFSRQIGGRTNEELWHALKDHGIDAMRHVEHPLLSPADQMTGSVLFVW